jgi:hypothetical protein
MIGQGYMNVRHIKCDTDTIFVTHEKRESMSRTLKFSNVRRGINPTSRCLERSRLAIDRRDAVFSGKAVADE